MSKIEGHECKGYEIRTDAGTEYECGYDTDILCDDCVFVVAMETGDNRQGRRPWSKSAQSECKEK